MTSVSFSGMNTLLLLLRDRETGNCIVSLAACLLPLEDKEPGPFLGIYYVFVQNRCGNLNGKVFFG